MAKLSPRQKQILDLISDTVTSRGYPPTVREIGQHLGLTSSATVWFHLDALVKKGVLRREPNKPRAIQVIEP